MSRYTFTCEHFNYDHFTGDETDISAKNTTEFRAGDLSTVLENFESFLRGAGYHFNGTIDIVEEESYEEYNEDLKYDFSSIPQNNWVFGDSKPESASSEDTIYLGEETIEINLDLGAAQPTMNFDLDNTMAGSSVEEKCSVCKIPKSVMVAQRCYDKMCPKTSYLDDFDYKLASEK